MSASTFLGNRVDSSLAGIATIADMEPPLLQSRFVRCGTMHPIEDPRHCGGSMDLENASPCHLLPVAKFINY